MSASARPKQPRRIIEKAHPQMFDERGRCAVRGRIQRLYDRADHHHIHVLLSLARPMSPSLCVLFAVPTRRLGVKSHGAPVPTDKTPQALLDTGRRTIVEH